MKKKIKIIVTTTVLLLTFFAQKNYEIYAEDLVNEQNIDLLIENKMIQDELENKIIKLQEEISEKDSILKNTEDNLNENSIEVVTVSFIKEEKLSMNQESVLQSSIKKDIELLMKDIDKIEKELEEYMIEGIRLEKKIEQESKNYLQENNQQYIQGIWPLESYKTISSPFEERIHPISGEYSFHKGIDIPAPQNTEILASDDGIVIFSGAQNGYGNVVKIKHFDGKETLYAHNTSNIVQEGDIVKRGQAIAKVGSTGNSTGNHVHFETIVDGEHINPLDVVSK